MKITIEQLQDKISEIFDESKVFSIESVYEDIEGSNDLRLIIFFHNIFYDDTNIIYTKFTFVTDNEKVYLQKNHFSYLYDINCEFKRINFSDLEEFENKVKDIFNNEKFGKELNFLSNFMKAPNAEINKWLSDNDLSEHSVYSFRYEPKVKIMPCKSLFFNFVLNLDSKYEINVALRKEREYEYELTFKMNDITEYDDMNNLKALPYKIGKFIKKAV